MSRQTKHIMLRLASFMLIVTAIFITGCGEKAAVVAVPPLPQVEISDVPSPASSTVVVKRGSNLQAIASEAYGHREFSGFVQTFNGIPSPESLQAGATLKPPSLPLAFREAGLDARYQPAINVLCKAWFDVKAVLPDYTTARYTSGVQDGGRFSIAPELSKKLLACADAIDAAIYVLNSPQGKGHTAPRMALNKFSGSSQILRSMADGYVGSLDYETFMMEKGFGLGFTYALIWTKENHQ